MPRWQTNAAFVTHSQRPHPLLEASALIHGFYSKRFQNEAGTVESSAALFSMPVSGRGSPASHIRRVLWFPASCFPPCSAPLCRIPDLLSSFITSVAAVLQRQKVTWKECKKWRCPKLRTWRSGWELGVCWEDSGTGRPWSPCVEKLCVADTMRERETQHRTRHGDRHGDTLAAMPVTWMAA